MNTTNIISTDRLDAARAKLQALNAEREEVYAKQRAIQKKVDAGSTDAGAAAALQQQRVAIYEDLLRRGRPLSEAATKLAAIDAQAQAQAAETKTEDARALQAAAAQIEAELSVRRAQCDEAVQAADAEVKAALVEAVQQQFEAVPMPALLVAIEELRQAFGKAYGVKLAMDRLKHRSSHLPHEVAPNAAQRTIFFDLYAMQMEDRLRGHPTLKGANYNGVVLNAGDLIDKVAADTLEAMSAST